MPETLSVYGQPVVFINLFTYLLFYLPIFLQKQVFAQKYAQAHANLKHKDSYM